MTRPRRPDRTTLDPKLLERGEIGELTAHWDRYFAPREPGALEVIFALAVDRLPEPDRSCVVMVAMHGLTYDDAAEHLAQDIGRRVHRKTVWRWVQRGLGQLRDEMTGASWMSVLLAGRVPSPGAVPLDGPDNAGQPYRRALEMDDATAPE